MQHHLLPVRARRVRRGPHALVVRSALDTVGYCMPLGATTDGRRRAPFARESTSLSAGRLRFMLGFFARNMLLANLGVAANLSGRSCRFRFATAAMFACAWTVAIAAAHQDASQVFTIEKLGPSDPAAVFDADLEQDAALRGSDGLVNFVEFRDVLTREELAGYLRQSHAPIAVRLAVWQCAAERWPSFVETLSSRRPAQRDEMIRSSREWGAQIDRDGVADPQLKSRHSRLVVRIQAERAAAEVRFLAELADCASTVLATQAGAIEGASATLADLPADLLEPLVQRARLRNTSESILGRPPRWMAVDPRVMLAKCSPTTVDRGATDDILRAFEASRSTLLLARYRAEWQALGHDEAERREAWRRVELLERRIRQETRSALRNIVASLDERAGERLLLLAAADSYPELAPALRQVARATDGSALTNAQDEAHAKFLVWREQAIAVTRRAIDELDATSERAGFLWIRSSDASLHDAIELARARLDSVVQGTR